MKKNVSLSIAVFLMLIATINLTYAQEEKNEQLYYGWEETVKPEHLNEYIELSQELVELCKQEKFSLTFYTWWVRPMVCQLWYPITSLNDIESINNEWDKILEKWGEEKYAAFNNTKMHNNRLTCIDKKELEFIPQNPDCERDEIKYEFGREIYLKPGKQNEFEEALKWLNEKRRELDFKTYVFYLEGKIGYEDPCSIILYGAANKLQLLEQNAAYTEEYLKVFQEYLDRIYPLMRSSKVFDWNYEKNLSYIPADE